MNVKQRRWLLVVVALVVLALLVAGVIKITSNKDTNLSEGDLAPATTPMTSTPSANTSEPDCSAFDGGLCPGAWPGNTQRSWPPGITSQWVDDSAHKTPGRYSIEMYPLQRPVWTPVNHDGDFPKKEDLAEGMGACEKPEAIKLEGKSQIQYVNGRYLPVNEKAGATRLDNGVPRGYAHSPQGAVMAALVLLSYGTPGDMDQVGYEVLKELWSSVPEYQEDLEKMDKNVSMEERSALRAVPSPAPIGYNVVNCSNDVVVVEVVSQRDVDSFTASKLPMFWRDGDWQLDLTGGSAVNQLVRDVDENYAYTEVHYS